VHQAFISVSYLKIRLHKCAQSLQQWFRNWALSEWSLSQIQAIKVSGTLAKLFRNGSVRNQCSFGH